MPKAGKNMKKYINNPPNKSGVGKPRAKVEGPGVWVTCVKGKERQTIGELYDLFESLAADLYPNEKDEIEPSARASTSKANNDEEDEEEEEDLEKALARELKELKKPRQGTRFANAKTDVVCAVFISCRPPIDPIRLVSQHFRNIERTGVTQTRHALRFTPVTDSCTATLPDIIKLAERLLPPAFQNDEGKAWKYKIQITSRNHSTVSRNDLIPALAKCVPEPHVVDLDHAELTILVELYMFVCGISVVQDYDRLKKFNCVAVADATRKRLDEATGSAEKPEVATDTDS
ncbi:hypothetical protein DL93DRAFT_389337 [Clavulina sp. PMI_390]|nr:hypothetical protein DL93DRAFT_389337 [Clavulina sp. PMI_390]